MFEPFLYQGYNLVFTAFPIIWWSIFDQEYEKQVLISDPSLYEIGLKNECFSTSAFFSSILNAIVNGFFLFIFCFYEEDGPIVDANRKNGSFWIDGTMVYAAIVLVVNLRIAYITNNHSWASTTLLILSILSFWGWFYVENLFSYFPTLYNVFYELVLRYECGLILFQCCWFNFAQFMFFDSIYAMRKKNAYYQNFMAQYKDKK